MEIIGFENRIVEEQSWGSLTWYASKALGGSQSVTVGKCVIKPGEQNPRHTHPNCDEILHVLEGVIIHTYADEQMKMEKGDTIVVPSGIAHNAVNIGETDAELSIAFSSGERKTVGE